MPTTELHPKDEFLNFLENDYLKGSGSRSSPCEGDYGELNRLLEEKNSTTDEERYLATFGYVAGGKSVSLAYELISAEGLDLSRAEDLSSYGESDLKYLRSDEYLNYGDEHIRRPNLEAMPETLLDVGENLSAGRVPVDSFSEFFNQIEFFHEKQSYVSPYSDETHAFNQAMNSLRNSEQESKADGLEQFGRVRTIDFLEAIVKVNGRNGKFDYFAKADIIPHHVNTSKPEDAMKTLFPDDQVTSIEKKEGLRDLQKELENRGVSERHSLFELETALCEFSQQD